MKVKINGKEMELTIQELEFVREQIGEWEIGEMEFEFPLYIPVMEIAEYFGISRQAIHEKAKRRGVESKIVGNVAFFKLEDVIKYWFEALK